MSAPLTPLPVPVIPAPVRSLPAGGVWRVGPAITISAPQRLAATIAVFGDDLIADTRMVTGVVNDDAPAEVVVELIAASRAGRAPDELPLPSGARADGAADADERYRLVIERTGARITAATAEGAHRALTTLRQLIAATATYGVAHIPCVTIDDGPRFAWRGLSVDVARTFHDAEAIRRVIDMCSLYKLNVLHLHLTDDQGWRFEVPEWPELTRAGAHYSRAEVAGLVRYAAERFVTLVPEVDLPGHSRAAFLAYPELAPAESPEAESAQQHGLSIGTLDLGRGPTRRFVRDTLAAAAAQFPTSTYVHVGGDEAFGMPQDEHARFVDFAIGTVRGLGRKAAGWQEAARGAVGPGEVVQYWIEPTQLAGMFDDAAGSSADGGMAAQLGIPPELLAVLAENFRTSLDDVPSALSRGARVLVSANSVLYLDRPHGDPAATEEQEAQRERVGLRAYPAGTLQDFVEWDPVEVTPGVQDDSCLAGVEAAVWCETVTDRDDLEFLLLPRLPGVAERAWSTARTEWSEYRARLAPGALVWERRGWNWYRAATVDWVIADLGIANLSIADDREPSVAP